MNGTEVCLTLCQSKECDFLIEAVGFDLGGTLIEYQDVPLSWQSLYSEALHKVAEACKVELVEADLENGKNILSKYNTRINPREVEVKDDQIFIEILSCWNVDYLSYLENAIEAFFNSFQRKSLVFSDTIETIKYLKNKGIKVGILTDVPYGMNRNFVKKDIIRFEEIIDCLLTSTEVGYRKPNSKGYEELALNLGTKPHKMIFVGDEEKDIVGAKAINMKAVLVDRHNKESTFKEDYRIKWLDDLKRIC